MKWLIMLIFGWIFCSLPIWANIGGSRILRCENSGDGSRSLQALIDLQSANIRLAVDGARVAIAPGHAYVQSRTLSEGNTNEVFWSTYFTGSTPYALSLRVFSVDQKTARGSYLPAPALTAGSENGCSLSAAPIPIECSFISPSEIEAWSRRYYTAACVGDEEMAKLLLESYQPIDVQWVNPENGDTAAACALRFNRLSLNGAPPQPPKVASLWPGSGRPVYDWPVGPVPIAAHDLEITDATTPLRVLALAEDLKGELAHDARDLNSTRRFAMQEPSVTKSPHAREEILSRTTLGVELGASFEELRIVMKGLSDLTQKRSRTQHLGWSGMGEAPDPSFKFSSLRKSTQHASRKIVKVVFAQERLGEQDPRIR